MARVTYLVRTGRSLEKRKGGVSGGALWVMVNSKFDKRKQEQETSSN